MNPFANTAESRSHEGSLSLFRGDYKKAEKSFLSVVSSSMREETATKKHKFESQTRELPSVFPVLYLPVEVSARELDARLLLAMHAVENGYHVIVGQSWSFLGLWSEMPPGVAVFKTMNTLDASNMEDAKNNGHIVCAIDEEGIGRPLSKDAFKMNLDPKAVSLADRIFVQGNAHADMIQKIYPGANTVVTGNPRAELFSDKYFRNKPGIHLFCSRAGNVNPAGRSFLACVQTTLKLAGGTSVRRMAKMFRESTRNELRSLQQFIDLARKTSETKSVVVRPHPVEDPLFWHSTFKNDDVEVDGSGSLRDWLKITDTMYCLPECGTEHEATLAGVPVKVLGKPQKDIKSLFESSSACTNITAELMGFPFNDTPPPEGYLAKARSGFQALPFHRRKFPETSLEQVMNKMGALKGMAGFESKFILTQTGDNQFYIRKN